MVPVIVLVGRANVGKSTFFNRLTCTRDALVADFYGLTRDRKYGYANVEGREFICIDTGGFNSKIKNNLEARITEQSMIAIEESDIVLFIVDAREGLMPDDFVIAKYLRLCKKPTFLVANKTDGINTDQAITDFWSLGLGKIYPISASHGRGISYLLDTILLPFLEKANPLHKMYKNALYVSDFKEPKKDQKNELKDTCHLKNLPIKVAIVGRPNAGKSTLTNCILGENRVLVYDTPGTTRDSIYISMQRDKRKYVLIDTAGIRKRTKITDIVEKFSVIKTLQAIEDANVVLLVIDGKEDISNQDLSLLRFILNSGRSLVIIVNKWDELSSKIREKIKKTINYRLGFINFARVHFISALRGSGIKNLFASICEAHNNSIRRQSTAMLTRIMNMAAKDHQLPLVGNRRVKLKYAHAGGYSPLLIVIHGNQVKDLPDSYKRYLQNYFRKSLDIIGTPVRIQFKEGKNPFAKKQSSTLQNQIHKFKHLNKYI